MAPSANYAGDRPASSSSSGAAAVSSRAASSSSTAAASSSRAAAAEQPPIEQPLIEPVLDFDKHHDDPFKELHLDGLTVDETIELTEADLAKQYRTIAKTCHPDKFGNAPQATARFRRLADAYDFLKEDRNWTMLAFFDLQDNQPQQPQEPERVMPGASLIQGHIEQMFS